MNGLSEHDHEEHKTMWTTRPESPQDADAVRALPLDPSRPVPRGTVRYAAAFGI